MAKQFKCTNYGVCPEADKDTIFIETDLEDVDGVFKCPHCGQELEELKKGDPGKGKMVAIIAAVAVVIALGLAAFFLFRNKEPKPVPAEPETPPSLYSPVESVTLDQKTLSLMEGATAELVAAVAPVDAEDMSVTWTSSDEKVVTVEDGKVNALKEGKATVTVVSVANPEAKDVCEVEVKKESGGKSSNSGNGGKVGGGKVKGATFSGTVRNGRPHGQGTLTFTSARLIDRHDERGRRAEAGDYIIGEWDNGHLIQGRWYDSANNVKGSIIVGKANNTETDSDLW
jgi:Bacterial surface proteins containing Ig-like domains